MMRAIFFPILMSVILLLEFVVIVSPIIHPSHHTTYLLPVHKVLYLERNFSDEELQYVLRAVMEWNEATNGQVVFDIQRLPVSSISLPDSIIMVHMSADYPEIILLDNTNDHSTLGYSHSVGGLSYIGLIDDRVDEINYQEVVLHELGHALGMEHIKGDEGIGTLMYPYTDLGSQHITKTDLDYFCKLYHCDARKFHKIEEKAK